MGKAKQADQQHCGTQQDQIGRVEAKLLSFPKVEGIVFGNWGEVSEATHKLVDALATCRARVAEPFLLLSPTIQAHRRSAETKIMKIENGK